MTFLIKQQEPIKFLLLMQMVKQPLGILGIMPLIQHYQRKQAQEFQGILRLQQQSQHKQALGLVLMLL